ncbi:MAG: efflux RND transporter periplasmic adaptor subunit, partial [Bacteroidia bacterium]|nr:efflux RND transporter periplasmic adaptor subunit [Bacteroidia bacterium]
AVNEQLGEFFVYLADSSKATQRKVKLGQQVGKDIIVSDGLKEGEILITEGIQNLREGTPITIFKPEAKQ